MHRDFPTKQELLAAVVADRLLDRAQRTGKIRGDIGIEGLHAVLAGALTIEQRLHTPESRARGIAVILDGLRR